jgi:hypothetical protein
MGVSLIGPAEQLGEVGLHGSCIALAEKRRGELLTNLRLYCRPMLANRCGAGQRGEGLRSSCSTLLMSLSWGNGFCRKGAELRGEPRRKMSLTS